MAGGQPTHRRRSAGGPLVYDTDDILTLTWQGRTDTLTSKRRWPSAMTPSGQEHAGADVAGGAPAC